MNADALDLLRRVLTARVYDVARESELEPAPALSRRLGHRVLLKREDNQPVFSFKLRGAYNKMVQLDACARARGVIAASAGNHAQGVALAAARLGVRATIVMPQTAPQVKVDAVRTIGGAAVEVVLAGDSYSDAQAEAARLEAEHGYTLVHPFDDPDVIAGQGTVGMEILRQHAGPLHAIFVPVGGGGLLAGVAAFVKAVRPEVKVIGVQSTAANAMTRSLAAGERVLLDEVGLFADGTAVKQVGALTFALCRQFVDDMICVDTDAIFPVSGETLAEQHGFGAALFARWRTEPDFILNHEVYSQARILVAGSDFGIGSSRETAVWALRGAGFRAIVAPSFGDIFRSNCVRNGLLAAVVDHPTRARLQEYLLGHPGAELEIDVLESTIADPDGGLVAPIRIDGFARRCLVEGVDEFALLSAYQEKVDLVLRATGTWSTDTRRFADDNPEGHLQ